MKRAALCILVAAITLPLHAAGFGRIDGYVTLSSGSTTIQSTMNATFFPDTIVCTGAISACRYALQGGHEIVWSRTGDVIAGRSFSTESQTYRNSISGPSAAGECYSAAADATYLFMAGTIAPGINIPFTPYEMVPQQTWQSSSVCRPSGAITLSQLCPLILDLEGNGIATSGLSDPVSFWDVDADGLADASGWLAPDSDDAFLWIDLNDDHVAQQDELFGSAMPKADGSRFANGFQALAIHDAAAFGGNGDGAIDDADGVWEDLRLWIDVNHDGVSQAGETGPLPAHRVTRLGLDRVHDHSVDPAGNSMMLIGSYRHRTHGNDTVERLLVDVAFAFTP